MIPKNHGISLCNTICHEAGIRCLLLWCNDNENFCKEREYRTSQDILEEFRHAGWKRQSEMWFMFQGLREKFDDIEGKKHHKSELEALRWFRLL